MMHQGILEFIGLPPGRLPTFENPYPSEMPTYQKGDLGWACQGRQVEQCQKWANEHCAQPIGPKELQIAFCIPCHPSHVTVK